MSILWKDSAADDRHIVPSPRVVLAAAGAMLRALRNRRAALQISDLSDDLLSDIGLRRDDVHAALKTSWREDPTYRLAVAARHRRGTRAS